MLEKAYELDPTNEAVNEILEIAKKEWEEDNTLEAGNPHRVTAQHRPSRALTLRATTRLAEG